MPFLACAILLQPCRWSSPPMATAHLADLPPATVRRLHYRSCRSIHPNNLTAIAIYSSSPLPATDAFFPGQDAPLLPHIHHPPPHHVPSSSLRRSPPLEKELPLITKHHLPPLCHHLRVAGYPTGPRDGAAIDHPPHCSSSAAIFLLCPSIHYHLPHHQPPTTSGHRRSLLLRPRYHPTSHRAIRFSDEAAAPLPSDDSASLLHRLQTTIPPSTLAGHAASQALPTDRLTSISSQHIPMAPHRPSPSPPRLLLGLPARELATTLSSIILHAITSSFPVTGPASPCSA